MTKSSTSKLISSHVRNKQEEKLFSEVIDQAIDTMQQVIADAERAYICDGVNFSRIQVAGILRARDKGSSIEFEAFAPYLAHYVPYQGVMTADNLLPEDAIGLALAASLRKVFPKARVVSLYDELNTIARCAEGDHNKVQFTQQMAQNFRTSLVKLLQSVKVIPPDAIEGKEYLLIPESEKTHDAEAMVELLEAKGHIHRKGKEIAFINERAENPLHQRIRLRTSQGRWLCEALDAAGYLKTENLSITHIVALPYYMREQQDKMWEILRVLGIDSRRYHNIFYDHTRPPQQIVKIVESFFANATLN